VDERWGTLPPLALLINKTSDTGRGKTLVYFMKRLFVLKK
jgi:hypothetical protein